MEDLSDTHKQMLEQAKQHAIETGKTITKYYPEGNRFIVFLRCNDTGEEKRVRWANYLVDLKRKQRTLERDIKHAEKHGYRVLGNGQNKFGASVLHIQCVACGYERHGVSYQNIKSKNGNGCISCFRKATRENAIQLAENTNRFDLNFYYKEGDRKGKLYMDSTHRPCGKRLIGQKVDGIKAAYDKGSDFCPYCMKHSQGFKYNETGVLYVVKWECDPFKPFIKFGITGDLNQRIKNQASKTDFKPSILFSVCHDNGNNTAEIEQLLSKVQQEHGGRAIEKIDFPDGYTETVRYTPEIADQLISVIKSYCFGF